MSLQDKAHPRTLWHLGLYCGMTAGGRCLPPKPEASFSCAETLSFSLKGAAALWSLGTFLSSHTRPFPAHSHGAAGVLWTRLAGLPQPEVHLPQFWKLATQAQGVRRAGSLWGSSPWCSPLPAGSSRGSVLGACGPLGEPTLPLSIKTPISLG